MRCGLPTGRNLDERHSCGYWRGERHRRGDRDQARCKRVDRGRGRHRRGRSGGARTAGQRGAGPRVRCERRGRGRQLADRSRPGGPAGACCRDSPARPRAGAAAGGLRPDLACQLRRHRQCRARLPARHGGPWPGRAGALLFTGRLGARAENVRLRGLQGRGQRLRRGAGRGMPGQRRQDSLRCPGRVDTPLYRRLAAEDPAAVAHHRSIMPASVVVDAVERSLAGGGLFVFPGTVAKAGIMLRRHFPRLLGRLVDYDTSPARSNPRPSPSGPTRKA